MKTLHAEFRFLIPALGLLVGMVPLQADTLTVEGNLNVDGNVGIGTDTPEVALDVVGDVKVQGGLTVTGNVSFPNQTSVGGSSVLTRDLGDARYLAPTGSGAGLTDVVKRWSDLPGVYWEDGNGGLNALMFNESGQGSATIYSYLGGLGIWSSSSAFGSGAAVLHPAAGWDLDYSLPGGDGDTGWATYTLLASNDETGIAKIGVIQSESIRILGRNEGDGLYVESGIQTDGDLNVVGATTLQADVQVKNNAVIRISPAGDLGMGAFSAGINPNL